MAKSLVSCVFIDSRCTYIKTILVQYVTFYVLSVIAFWDPCCMAASRFQYICPRVEIASIDGISVYIPVEGF